MYISITKSITSNILRYLLQREKYVKGDTATIMTRTTKTMKKETLDSEISSRKT